VEVIKATLRALLGKNEFEEFKKEQNKIIESEFARNRANNNTDRFDNINNSFYATENENVNNGGGLDNLKKVGENSKQSLPNSSLAS
jgi:hypothetical protein